MSYPSSPGLQAREQEWFDWLALRPSPSGVAKPSLNAGLPRAPHKAEDKVCIISSDWLESWFAWLRTGGAKPGGIINDELVLLCAPSS